MVLVKEFRVPLPISVEEYRLAQRYCTARASKEATTGKDGVEVVESKPYTDEKTGAQGLYTYKVYHLEGYVPAWLRAIIPASALELHEKSWDRYPYCKTVLTNPFLGDKFHFEIESMHAADLGEQDNILGITDRKVLKKRKVVFLDIAKDTLPDKTKYKADEDPTKVGNKKMPPLSDGWQKRANPKMCCYKLVTVRCKIWGLQNKMEDTLMATERDIFLKFHQEVFCWLNDWYGLSEEEIFKLVDEFNKAALTALVKEEKNEEEIKAVLKELESKGPVT
jgi:hypothetical protein